MGKNNNKNVDVKNPDPKVSDEETPAKLTKKEQFLELISEEEHNKNQERLEKIKV